MFSARAVVDETLGDAERRYYPSKPPPTATQAPIPTEATDVGRNESIGVLTVKEAAPRLGHSTTEMEEMIARGREDFGRGMDDRDTTSDVEQLRHR